MRTTLRQLINWLGLEEMLLSASADWETTVTGVSTDTRTLQKGDVYVPLIGERFDGHDFITEAVQKGASAIVYQQGCEIEAVTCPAINVPDTLEALQRMAKGYRHHLNIPVIAVTGSNGKTTTKDLIASVLATRFHVHKTKGNLNNHIGLPLTLLSMPAQTEVVVLEMGMNHKGEIAHLSRIAEPDLAIITNVGDAHIANFNSQKAIAEAKLEIVAGLKPDGMLWINGDDSLLCEGIKDRTMAVQTVGVGGPADEKASYIEMIGSSATQFVAARDARRYEIPLLGQHNVMNALFAIAIGRRMGLKPDELAHGLKSVQLSGRRLQLKETKRGMWVIDDSYNSNPTAVKAGIDTLTQMREKTKKWVLLGDIFELGERAEDMHRDLGQYASEQAIECVFTIGARASWIHEEAIARGLDPEAAVHFSSIEQAIEELRLRDNPDTVLLIKASRGMALERVVEALCHPQSPQAK